MRRDGDGGSPQRCLLGQDQCLGMLVWVAEVAQLWSSSVLPGGTDRWKDALQLNLSSHSCLRWANHHWEILELPRLPGWDRGAGMVLNKLLLMRSRRRAQHRLPAPLSPLGVSLYFLKS